MSLVIADDVQRAHWRMLSQLRPNVRTHRAPPPPEIRHDGPDAATTRRRERQARVLELRLADPDMHADDIAQRLQVTGSTVRKDLQNLKKAGKLKRRARARR